MAEDIKKDNSDDASSAVAIIFQNEYNKGEKIRELFRDVFKRKLIKCRQWHIDIMKEELIQWEKIK